MDSKLHFLPLRGLHLLDRHPDPWSLRLLLADLGWPDPVAWVQHWQIRGGSRLAYRDWSNGIADDWIWGLGLPLLTEIEKALVFGREWLLGLSALPGCGKTSLGQWIQAAARQLNWPVYVLSLDDFYWPAKILEGRMAGNPWNVPRALPGSHDLNLLAKTIDSWRHQGTLTAPCFSKHLRGGYGDRSGWQTANPRVLLLEGWFLGCRPWEQQCMEEEPRDIQLTDRERAYRQVVHSELVLYQSVWQRLDRLWQLRAIDHQAVEVWKRQQELSMHLRTGNSLTSKELNRMIRMIRTAMPSSSLHKIPADVVAEIRTDRSVPRIGLAGQPSASSVSSTG